MLQKDPTTMPKKEIITQILLQTKLNLPKIRRKPAVPNFNNNPAKIILAVVGAST